MKKILSYIIFCLLVLIVFPICSFAMTYDTEMYAIDTAIPNQIYNKILLKNVGITAYTRFGLSGKPAYHLGGEISNEYQSDIEYNVHIKFYDADGNYLGDVTKPYELLGNNKKTFDFVVSKGDNLGFDFDLIFHYSIAIELLTDIDRSESLVNETYYINNYNITINVNENNIYDIEETFDASFKKHVTEIKKSIPIRLIYKSDLDRVNKRTILSNVDMNHDYTSSLVKGNNVYSIGRLDMDTNTRSYNIKYSYNVGKDTLNDKDEVVYYLNNEYEGKIDGVNFKIILPKETDVKVSLIDQDGYEVDENFTYEIEGNVITGNFDKLISNNTLYAVRVELPNKYFVKTSSNINMFSVLTLFVSLILIVISIIIWSLYTSKKNIKIDSLYPYKNINSIEFSYLYNGKIKDSDIGTLLFKLCNDGYVEIIKTKQEYMIVKKREYVGSNGLEKVFMDELFKNNDQVDRKQLNLIMKTIKERIIAKQDTKSNRKKLFVNELFSVKVVFWLFIIIIFALITINSLMEYQMSSLWINLIITGLGFGLVLKGTTSRSVIIEKIIIALVGVVLIISPIIFTCLEAFTLNMLNIMVYVIGLISMIIITFISNELPSRTRYGRKILNTLRSYKDYLLQCDMSIIDEEMINNRYYFYNMIPYVYVLGIVDKWYDRFSNVELTKPTWYLDDNKKFDRELFYDTVREIYSDMYLAMKK